MNYSNEQMKACKDAIKAEFGKMTNKELYAWLRTNYPTQKFLTGQTKDQLHNEIYVCRFIRDDKIDHAKERDERTDMGSNDKDAPADAETDAEDVEEDDKSVADDVSIPADMFEEPEDDESVTGSDIFGDEQSDDDDDTPVATLIANKVAENKDELIAKLQAQVAELKLQLQDAKDDIKDMVAGLKGIITNQQSRETCHCRSCRRARP